MGQFHFSFFIQSFNYSYIMATSSNWIVHPFCQFLNFCKKLLLITIWIGTVGLNHCLPELKLWTKLFIIIPSRQVYNRKSLVWGFIRSRMHASCYFWLHLPELLHIVHIKVIYFLVYVEQTFTEWSHCFF